MGGRRAWSEECGEKVSAETKVSMLERWAGGQKPLFKTLSERAMHSIMSPERYAWMPSAGMLIAEPGGRVM